MFNKPVSIIGNCVSYTVLTCSDICDFILDIKIFILYIQWFPTVYVGVCKSIGSSEVQLMKTVLELNLCFHIKKTKPNSMVRVRERTIPTERPPLVGEVIANLCG
jgi:hypothetical protein